MSDLPEEAMEQLAVYDDTLRDYTPFQVGDETVLVGDDRLAEAPRAIPEKERNIILLYWFPRIGGPINADVSALIVEITLTAWESRGER